MIIFKTNKLYCAKRRSVNKRFLTVLLCAFVLTASSVAAFAQQAKRQISGTVLDETGVSVIGANILEKGTTNGVVTDVDGKFSLPVSTGAVLQVSYIGYVTQEIATGTQTVLQITLQEDAKALDEVIVIGYGTAKRRDFTGSVTSIKLEESPIALTTNLNALESLKGNVTGLDIGATNSAGGQPSMLIRGQKSISGNNDPLVVVDGMIYLGNIGDLNPNDIASFDVLKDATSAAVYGSRSANGVIMITTKKGKTGKPVVSFNATGGMQSWHLRPILNNGEQWMDAMIKRNQFTDDSFLYAQQKLNRDNGVEYDWLGLASRTGWIQDYQAAVSGASEKMNYYLSASLSDNKAVIYGDDYDRLSVLSKISTDITDWLRTGIDLSYSRSDYSGFASSLLWGGIMNSPYSMLYRAGGNAENKLYEKSPSGLGGTNPRWGIYDESVAENTDVRNNFRANAYVEVKLPFVPGLSYNFSWSGTLDDRASGSFSHEQNFVPSGAYDDLTRYSEETYRNQLGSAGGNYMTERTNSYVLDNILKYNRVFGRHTIDVTAVATRDRQTYRLKNIIGSDFSANGNTLLGLDGLNFAKTQRIEYRTTRDNKEVFPYVRSNVGYLGRVSYSFADTYYLTGSYRRDGASVFGSENKWGDFGAIAGAWRISNEKFMSGQTLLDDLKLKLSWGRNGNQGLDPYGTLSRVANGQSGGLFLGFGNTGQSYYGIRQTTLGNAALGWETTEAWNIGLEAALLDNRLFVDAGVYFANTTDQIFQRTIPSMTGFSTMYSSMGEVSNKGVEVTVRSENIRNSDWNWTTGLTFWLNRNKLVHLYGEDLDGDGREDDDISNAKFIGKSIHAIFGYKQDGIVQTNDTEYISKYQATPGHPKYVDITGDGKLDADDRIILGAEDPNFKLNLNSTLTYRNWELYALFAGVFGGNGYYQKANTAAFMAGGDPNQFGANSIYIPYWTESNPSNKYLAPTFVDDSRFLGLQSRTYVRFQDLTLSYTFRQAAWLKQANISHLKVFFTGKNLFTITGWTAGDPEIGSTLLQGQYPVLTTYSLGLNLSF